ncbi:hypothetical protein APX70_05844, partial [Pseudomonas syringae pv. maculicola]
RDATPALIDGKNVAILDRSSAYWKAKGNAAWGDAIRGFRVSMVAMGGFGLAAVTLELFDVTDDFHAAKTSEETYGIGIKGFSVVVMGLGAAAQLMAGISPAGVFTIIA